MAREELDLGRWCILRMASADTLSVMEYLNRRGIEAWTPVDRKIGRMPRTRAEYDKRFALMPSYVFAAADRIGEVAHIAALPKKECPRFSLFMHQGGYPLVAEEGLSHLRAEEARRRSIFEKWQISRRKPPKFARGTEVNITEGAFAGMTGTIEEQQGRFTLVGFPGFDKPIKIASLLLAEDVVSEQTDIAASKAA